RGARPALGHRRLAWGRGPLVGHEPVRARDSLAVLRRRTCRRRWCYRNPRRVHRGGLESGRAPEQAARHASVGITDHERARTPIALPPLLATPRRSRWRIAIDGLK